MAVCLGVKSEGILQVVEQYALWCAVSELSGCDARVLSQRGSDYTWCGNDDMCRRGLRTPVFVLIRIVSHVYDAVDSSLSCWHEVNFATGPAVVQIPTSCAGIGCKFAPHCPNLGTHQVLNDLINLASAQLGSKGFSV